VAQIPTPEVLWKEYAKSIFAGMSISQTQYEETQQAFYAGLFSFSQWLGNLDGLSDKAQEEATDMFMSRLVRELEFFIERKYKRITGPVDPTPLKKSP